MIRRVPRRSRQSNAITPDERVRARNRLLEYFRSAYGVKEGGTDEFRLTIFGVNA